MIAFIVVTVVIIAWVLHALGLGWRSDFQGVNTPLDKLSTASRVVKSIERNMRSARNY
jgi:hypothetical protein